MASTLTVTVLILEFVSSRFMFQLGIWTRESSHDYCRGDRYWWQSNSDVCQRCCHGFNLVQDDRGSDVLRAECIGTALICGESSHDSICNAGKHMVETKV